MTYCIGYCLPSFDCMNTALCSVIRKLRAGIDGTMEFDSVPSFSATLNNVQVCVELFLLFSLRHHLLYAALWGSIIDCTVQSGNGRTLA